MVDGTAFHPTDTSSYFAESPAWTPMFVIARFSTVTWI
jgi:hypothetical protein